MSARLLLNLGLLALCVALGWFAFKPDTAPPPSTVSIAITGLSADVINDIRIERDAQQIVHLQRDGTLWRLHSPVAAAADGFRVSALLSLASAHSDSGFRAAGNDLTQYGLEPARATVQFNDTTLLIGETDPVAGRRYVLVDEQVHLLEDNWFSQIFGNSAAWLDPRPLPRNSLPTLIEIRDSRAPTRRWQQVDGHWDHTGAAVANAWTKARALSVQNRDETLNWNGQILVQFDRSNPSTSSTTAAITFAIAHTDDAFLLARDDLDVQYRFLTRQGEALMGLKPSPKP